MKKLDGKKIETGIEIPTLGKAVVDDKNNVVQVDRILTINKDTIADLVKMGL